MKRILFISHEATRTGAPFVLLSLLKELKEGNCCSFDLLLLKGGSLAEEFRQVAGTTYVLPSNVCRRRIIKLLSKLFEKKHPFGMWMLKLREYLLKHQYDRVIHILTKRRYSLIYANSSMSLDIAVQIKKVISQPLVLHVHETEYFINATLGQGAFLGLAAQVDHFIAVSNLVKNTLLVNYGIDERQVSLAYPFSPNTRVEQPPEIIYQELGIDRSAFIVGGSGRTSWIKGCDVFITLAKLFVSRYAFSPCVFMWVGEIDREDEERIRYDVINAGLSDTVLFINQRIYPQDYYNICDVFLLTSRLESFGLVCLESAALAKPVICFETTGIAEFVEEDCGFVIPYLDLTQMAEKLFALYRDPSLRKKMGQMAKIKAASRYSQTECIVSIESIVDTFLD